uniref:NAAA-beta domain-containing protein n=1 Tax=Strongyloides stercoralis TaxID=6248 RepID=A0A0K0ED95_STRER
MKYFYYLIVYYIIFNYFFINGLKIYNISLETKPRERWKIIVNDYKNEIINLLNETSKLILPIIFPSSSLRLQNKINNNIHFNLIELLIFPKLPFHYREEIYGIAINLNRSVGEVLILNIYYDLLASEDMIDVLPFVSSSIILKCNQTSIYHGSKIDYLFKDLIKNMTFIVNFYQNDNILFTSLHYGGFIGVINGVKRNKFTISLNSRGKGNYIDNIKFILYHQFNPITLIIRATLEYENTFEDAMLVISETPYVAPASFTITGTKYYQGIVVTTDRYKTLAIKNINESIHNIILSNEEEKPLQSKIILSEINYQMTNDSEKVNFGDILNRVLENNYTINDNSSNIFQTVMSANFINYIYNYSKFIEKN